jgi:small subunit ribosomal protein S1
MDTRDQITEPPVTSAPAWASDAGEDVEDFSRALDQWEAGLKSLKEGDVVQGRVIKILDKEVIVDIGYKSEGVVDLDEFRGPDGVVTVKEGDRLEVLLEKAEDEDGYVVLSKEKAEKMKVWDEVERAYETGEPILGRVVDRIKGGLKVDIGLPAFLPGSLVDVRPVRNLESLRGQEFRMRVIKVNRRRGNIVLSRKAVLEEENAEKKKKTLTDLEEGKVFRGTVKNLTEYGAFIDLGGIDGLLHITDMSWGRIQHPSEKFQIGDELDVVVLKFDRERERVSLGFKQLQEDPWEFASAKYPPGTRIRGKVVSLTDYGAFVEVEEGIEGLIHVSEMSWTKRVKHPSKILNQNDWVEAVILKIDSENQRLSLGMKQLQPNVAEDFFRSHGVGDILTGRVVRTTEFGAFVELYEGIEGLVHVSELSKDRVEKSEDAVQVDQQVRVKIIKMDPVEKKIGLSIKAALEEPEEASLSDYVNRQEGDGSATLGDLVDRDLFQRGAGREDAEADSDEDR